MQVSAGHLKMEPLISRCLGSSWSKLSLFQNPFGYTVIPEYNKWNHCSGFKPMHGKSLSTYWYRWARAQWNLRLWRKVWLSKRTVIIRLAHKPPASPNQMISTVSPSHTPLEALLFKKNAFSFQGPCLPYFSLYFWGGGVGLNTKWFALVCTT